MQFNTVTKNDLIFKKIFGEHANLLQSFLNAVLPLPKDCHIESLTYLPVEHVPEIAGLKHTLVDVRCLDNHGRPLIVEMHNLHYYSTEAANCCVASVLEASRMSIRSDFCAPRTPCTSSTSANINADSKIDLEDFGKIEAGNLSNSLSPVYGLAIVDDTFSGEQEWFHHYQLKNSDGTKKIEDIQLVFIELPNLKPTNITEKKLAILWLRFLKEIGERTEKVDPALLEVEEICEALTLLEIASYNEAELLAYDRNWDSIRSEKTLMEDKYEDGLMKGRAEGEAKGKAEGLVEGEAKGVAKGKAEGLAEGEAKAKTQMIQKLHASGFSLEKIAELAELPQDQVERLLKSQD